MTKIEALAQHFGCDVDDISTPYANDESSFEIGRTAFLVLTDEEADERCAEYIADSLWAFNASFVLSFIGCRSARAEKAFAKMQGELCEDANDLVAAMIGDRMPDFVKQAISADGRGHFLSGYDGSEAEVGEFYIYRTN